MKTTSRYIKGRGNTVEVIDGRIKVGHVRCPKCFAWLGVYKDEINYEGEFYRPKKCYKCGYIERYVLEDWEDK